MRKFYMMAFPLLLVVFLACGCAANRDADAMCEFDCDSLITLKIGTANAADAVAYAPLLTNTMIQYINIEYDKTIINYEPATGRIEALRAGTTRIKSTVNGKTKSVQVKVEQAIYCTYLQCTDFAMEFGKTADMLSSSRNYLKINKGYNMGYTFESLTPEILDIDASGVITANSVGDGAIKIVAKTGVNPNANSGYEILPKTIRVTVMERRDDLSLSILNANMDELDYTLDEYGIKNYELYSTSDKSIGYVLKISSDQSLDNCMFTEKSTYLDCDNYIANSTNKRLFVQNEGYTLATNQKTVFQGFYVVDCGTDVIQKGILDSGYNFYYDSLSERINIRVYKLATNDDISAKVYNSECTEEYALTNKDKQYCLYYSDDDSENSVVYVDPEISEFCNQKWDYDAENITVTQADNGMLKVSYGQTVGMGRLIIKATDGSTASQTIEFYNYRNAITITTTAAEKTVIYMHNGSASFTADYAVHDEAGKLIENQLLEFLFYDANGDRVILGANKVAHKDAMYPNFIIEFVKEGKYTVVLKAQGMEYYSEFLYVYVYDENSLTK